MPPTTSPPRTESAPRDRLKQIVRHLRDVAVITVVLGHSPALVPVTIHPTDITIELHRLCGWLYNLASAFTTFYEHCPVLRAEPDVREHRLALCSLTAQVLARGLDLLGITAPERM